MAVAELTERVRGRVKTGIINDVVKVAAKLPHYKEQSIKAAILNHISNTYVSTLTNHANKIMDQRMKIQLDKGKIDVAQYYQRKEFLGNLINLIQKRFLDLSKNVRNSLVNNLIVENMVSATEKKKAFEGKYGFFPPALMVVSPTMACNLACEGCYAFMYEKNKGLENEVLDNIIRQAKDIGIHFVVISGGEPFVRKDDMLNMAQKHNNVQFMFYTNGTFIDENLSKELSEIGNIMPCISVEGFRKETQERRKNKKVPDVYDRILRAMYYLNDNGVFYNFSFTTTSKNIDIILGKRVNPENGLDFFDFWIDRMGCFGGWVFHYIPTGQNPDCSLMPSPQDTIERDKKIREKREKGYVISSFWGDGYLTNESICMAGARNYFHIVSSGDVEPCVFAHYTSDGNNIKKKSLIDILNSPYFKHLRARKFENPLSPCMLIHEPDYLREDARKFNLMPTTNESCMINDAMVKNFLDEWSMEYRALADIENARMLGKYTEKAREEGIM